MKASIVLIVALLGFTASVAWAQERKATHPADAAQPAAGKGEPRARQPRPATQPIPMLAPHLDPAKRSPALAICACVRRRDQA